MTDIELATPSPDTNQFEIMLAIATRVASTKMVPDQYQGKPDEALAAMLYGHEIGLSPMQSLTSINVVKGKPALSAEAMRALIMAAGHKVECITGPDGATVTITRKDTGATYTATFGPAEADQAKLRGENYDKYPAAMYLARATTAAARMGVPDVLKGISYTAEELGAIDAKPVEPQLTAEELALKETQRSLFEAIKALSEDSKQQMRDWCVEHDLPLTPSSWTADQCEQAAVKLAELRIVDEFDADEVTE